MKRVAIFFFVFGLVLVEWLGMMLGAYMVNK